MYVRPNKMLRGVALSVLVLISLGSCNIQQDNSETHNTHHANNDVTVIVNEEGSEEQIEKMKKEIIAAISGEEYLVSELALRQRYLGEEWKYAAYSCKEISERKPNLTSGYYWTKTDDDRNPYLRYCDLEEEYVAGIKGWARVANWNMNEQLDCPSGFNLISGSRRLCGKGTYDYGCDSIRFYTNDLWYRRVCGRVVAYRHLTPDGFLRYNCPSPCTLNDPYVDGVSITIPGSGHVWSFAAYTCDSPTLYPPAFVGNNYFCDSSNPLWNDRWFCTELHEPTDNYLQLRLCTDQNLADEDVRIELVELYVH